MSNDDLIARLRARTSFSNTDLRLHQQAADALTAQAAELADAVKTILAADAKIDEQAREIEALRAALELSLDALNESIDNVQAEVEERHAWYSKMPTRAAQLAGADKWLADHWAAIDAARAALASGKAVTP